MRVGLAVALLAAGAACAVASVDEALLPYAGLVLQDDRKLDQPAAHHRAHEARELLSLVAIGEVHHERRIGTLGAPDPSEHRFQPWGWFTWIHSISMLACLKAACMGSNVLFQMSPYPQVRQIKKEQSTGQSDGAPFVSIAFSCCQWTFYGMFAWLVTGTPGFLVIVYANSLGVVLGIFYVWTFHKNCKNQATLDKLHLYYKVIAFLVLAQINMMVLLPAQSALFYSGLIASGCTLVSAASPLTVVPTVVKTKNSEGLAMPLTIALFVSSLLWFSCGVILTDKCITYPNFVGCVIGFFLLVLSWKYPASGEVLPQKAKVLKEGFEEKVPSEKLEPNEETPFVVAMGTFMGSTGETLDAPGGTF